MKRALFPGSFDPFTIGHESVVRRALPMFDEIIVAIGYNTLKDGFFPVEKRMEWTGVIFGNEPRVKVMSYQGLTIDFCRQEGARFILRGLRTSADFEYERTIAHMNRTMYPDLETVFLLTLPEHSHISSTIVREIIRYGGDARKFLSDKIDLGK